VSGGGGEDDRERAPEELAAVLPQWTQARRGVIHLRLSD